MSSPDPVHPDVVLEALLGKARRSTRTERLLKLQKICRAQYDGSKDFSKPTIGKLCELASIFKARVIYNAGSEDYRALLEAWQKFSGSSGVKVSKPATESFQPLLGQIDNLVVRALVQGILVERNRLRGELNILKSLTVLQIDCRPNPPQQPASSEQNFSTPLKLLDYELAAISRATSSQFIEDQAWKKGQNGEILSESGRVIFDVGYLGGLAKILKVVGG